MGFFLSLNKCIIDYHNLWKFWLQPTLESARHIIRPGPIILKGPLLCGPNAVPRVEHIPIVIIC